MKETFIERENKGREIGWNEGKATGRHLGMLEGQKKKEREIIVRMIKNNFNDETIYKISKISEKELQRIKNSIRKGKEEVE